MFDKIKGVGQNMARRRAIKKILKQILKAVPGLSVSQKEKLEDQIAKQIDKKLSGEKISIEVKGKKFNF